MLLQAAAGEPVQVSGLWTNLVPVIAGNLVGGSVLVALVYFVIYRRGAAASPDSSSRTASGPGSE
jgi:formate/nitrite transporter FocA (FNT family)